MVQRRIIFFLITAFLITFPVFGQTQQPNVQTRLSVNKIAFGDTLSLYIRVENPGNALLNFPLPEKGEESRSDIEIYGERNDTTFDASQKILAVEHRFLLAVFTEGKQEISGFRLDYMFPADTAMQTITLPVLPLEVMAMVVDTTQTIKDIQPIEKEPFTFKEIEHWVVLGFGILAFVLLSIYFIKRYLNREKIAIEIAKPMVPPEKWALDEIEKLRQKRLWQNGCVKEYYTELTDILREYLYRAYQIQAAEMISDEILEAVQQSVLGMENENLLQQILATSDLVKFAKLQPVSNEHDLNMNNAVVFIKQTTADRHKQITEQQQKEKLNEESN